MDYGLIQKQMDRIHDMELAHKTDWAFEIICPECDQIIVRNLYTRDFDSGQGVGIATQKLMLEHILQAHPDELEELDDDDKDIPAD